MNHTLAGGIADEAAAKAMALGTLAWIGVAAMVVMLVVSLLLRDAATL